MKKGLLTAALCFLSFFAFSKTVCVKIQPNKKSALFEILLKETEEYAKKEYKITNFSVDQANFSFKGEREFKVKRRKPLIGIPPEFKKKPKWKREKIEIEGYANDEKACISVKLIAYNKRTKKWHKLKSNGLLEESVASAVLTASLKGKKVWSIGNAVVEENGTMKRILNLKEFQVDSVDISVNPSTSIKAVNFTLISGNQTYVYPVLMIDKVKTLQDAYTEFEKHFVDYNPFKKVPKNYEFFWEYAKHGEIMAGMHKQQLIAALGFPQKIVKKSENKEVYVYYFNNKKFEYEIVNDEFFEGEE